MNNPSFQTDVVGICLSQPCNGSWLALSPVSVSSIVSRYQHFSLKTLGPGLAAGRRMASVAPCSSRSQQKRPKTLRPGLSAGCRMAITRLIHLHLDLVQKSPVFSTKSRNRPILLKNRRYFQPNPGKNLFLVTLFCASDETRTRTGITAQGILSPSCLPFHHQGDDVSCKDKKNLRDIAANFLLLLRDSLPGQRIIVWIIC